jgi:hypothetical protein
MYHLLICHYVMSTHPRILSLNSPLKEVVSFIPWAIERLGTSLHFLLNTRLVEPANPSRHFEAPKPRVVYGTELTPVSFLHYSHYIA